MYTATFKPIPRSLHPGPFLVDGFDQEWATTSDLSNHFTEIGGSGADAIARW